MLILTITLWPHRDASQARVIAEGRIVNDGTGTHEHGNYRVAFRERSRRSGRWKPETRRHLTGWPRLRYGAWALVAAALTQCTKRKNSMHRTKVESSNVKSVGFDREQGLMEVEYRSGGIYQYADVKPEEYAALLAAESKGRHLQRHFVQAGRAYARVEEGEEQIT